MPQTCATCSSKRLRSASQPPSERSHSAGAPDDEKLIMERPSSKTCVLAAALWAVAKAHAEDTLDIAQKHGRWGVEPEWIDEGKDIGVANKNALGRDIGAWLANPAGRRDLGLLQRRIEIRAGRDRAARSSRPSPRRSP